MVFSVDVQILKQKKSFSRATELDEDNSNYILTEIYNMQSKRLKRGLKKNNENI